MKSLIVASWMVWNHQVESARAGSCDGDSCQTARDCCGDGCCGDGCCGGWGCPWQHCNSVWAGLLYLHPTGADMAHAQQQNGTGGAGTVPFGRIGAADPDYEPGFEIGANWALTNVSSVVASYTWFESDTRDSLPVGPGTAVGSLVQHPGAGIISSAGPLNAAYDISFELADLKYRRLLFGDQRGWMNYSVGARYGNLDQDFLQTGVFSGSQAGTIAVLSDVEFDGAGAIFGIDGERRFGRRGLSFYGNLSVSPLAGEVTSFYSMQNATTNTLLAQSIWEDDRFITILEYELGIAWTSCDGCWRIASGYTAAFWYNAVTTPVWVDAVQGDNYVDVGDTLSFDGLTLRVERRF